MTTPGWRVREAFTIAEFEQVCDVEQSVWGPSEKVDNPHLLRALQDEGALIAAVELLNPDGGPTGEFVGMLFAFPTREAGVQHSHRMGVIDGWRGQGIAEELKLFQKQWCLGNDITTVRWTFDPLRRTNARLNIHRLGATASSFYENHYGEEEADEVVVYTDRLMANWNLESGGRPTRISTTLLPIPDNIAHLRARDPLEAAAWQVRYRSALPELFANGFVVTDVVETPEAETASAYLLTQLW